MEIERGRPLFETPDTLGESEAPRQSSRLIIHGVQEMSSESLEIEGIREEPEVIYGQKLEGYVKDDTTDARTAFITQNNYESFGLSDEQYARGLLLLGDSGSGKTNVLKEIVKTLRAGMNENDIMVVFESTGELKQQVGQLFNTRDIVIGNGIEYRKTCRHWNIYEEIVGKELAIEASSPYQKIWESNAREIIKSLLQNKTTSVQPLLADAAIDMIIMKIIYDLRNQKPSQLYTNILADFLKKADAAQYDEIVQQEIDFNRVKMYYGDGTASQAAVFSCINSMVSDYFYGIFGGESSFQGFSMHNLIHSKGGKTIFIEYDLQMGDACIPNYSMLYDQALKAALERSSTEKGRVYFICDELKLLGRLSHIEDGLNYGRDRGIIICASLQSVNQLYDLYGEEKAKAILSGFSNKICFRAGDAETRNFISEYFGSNYSKIPSGKNVADRTYIQREGRVVEDWDIQRLQLGEAIVGLWSIEGRNPFKFRFEKY